MELISELTRELFQPMRSVWADVLDIGRVHSADKNLRRVRAIGLPLFGYSRLIGLAIYDSVL